MKNDDLDQYDGIFNDDEVIDTILLSEEVEKGYQKKNNSGCFTTLLAISGSALLGLLFFIWIIK